MVTEMVYAGIGPLLCVRSVTALNGHLWFMLLVEGDVDDIISMRRITIDPNRQNQYDEIPFSAYIFEY